MYWDAGVLNKHLGVRKKAEAQVAQVLPDLSRI